MNKQREQQLEEIKTASRGSMPALAIELSRKYLKHYPDDPFALMWMGMELQSMARYDEARWALEDAMLLFAEETLFLVYRQMGLLYRDKGDLREAEHWYRMAIENCPDDAGNYIYMGGLFVRQGKFDEAEEYYRQATACREGCVDEAYLNLGHVLRAKEAYVEAYDSYRTALDLDPEYKEAKEALTDIEKVLSLLGEA